MRFKGNDKPAWIDRNAVPSVRQIWRLEALHDCDAIIGIVYEPTWKEPLQIDLVTRYAGQHKARGIPIFVGLDCE